MIMTLIASPLMYEEEGNIQEADKGPGMHGN
jgi:hypothetical protein